MANEVSNRKYRYLGPTELIRVGDHRFDYEFGWTVIQDSSGSLNRFSTQYRRVGRAAAREKRFRRPVERKT